MSLKNFLSLHRLVSKPLKIDVRSVCEHNIHGPITRTFLVPRKDLISLLSIKGNEDIIDRVDISEYEDESRITVYSPSRIDHPAISPIRQLSQQTTEWDLEPQYGEYSARGWKWDE